MGFEIQKFFLEFTTLKGYLRPDLAWNRGHDILHSDIMIGMDDIQSWIECLYGRSNFIDRLVMFHQVVCAWTHSSTDNPGDSIRHFIYMDKAPVLIPAPIDRNLSKEICIKKKPVCHCINPVRRVISIYISRSEDVYFPCSVENP